MKDSRLLNIILGIFLVVLLAWFIKTAIVLYPLLIGAVLVFCSICLSSLLPYVGAGSLIMGTLLVGSLFLILFRTYHFSKSLKISTSSNKTIDRLAFKHQLQGKIILFDDDRPQAFCLGYWKPKIYLSQGLLSMMSLPELEAVVTHEKQHLINNDNLVTLILYVLRNTFFFLPVVADFVNSYHIQKEIKADRGTIHATGRSGHLISALRKVIDYPSFNITSINTFSQKHDIEIRVKSLLGIYTPKYMINGRSLLVSAIMILLAVNVMANKVEVHPSGQQSSSVCLDNNICEDECQS